MLFLKKKFNKKYIKFIVLIFILLILMSVALFAMQKAGNNTGSRTLKRVFGMFQTTLIYGVFYAMMALGFAMIFGAARVINLFHGSFYMLGAYLFASFSRPEDFNFSTGWFILFQIIIVSILIIFIFKLVKKSKDDKNEIKLSKKISLPFILLFLGQIPILLLFFKVKLPTEANLNLFIGLIYACAFVGVISIFINKYLIEPVRSKTITVLLITISLAFFMERFIDAIYGTSAIPVHSFVRTKPVTLLMGNTIDSKRLLMFFVGIVLIVLVWLLMNKTRIGKGVLAVAQDEEAAELMGVNPRFVYSFTIAVSAILAALAGIFTTPFLGDARPDIWLSPVIKAFAIVILGGLGSIFGSVLAAFILAFVEKFTKYFISSSLEEFVFLIVIIIILIIRPQGLFGKKGRF